MKHTSSSFEHTSHSRGALQAINRRLIEAHCYAGDRVDIEAHLLAQSRLAHDQTIGVRRVAQLLSLADTVLSEQPEDAGTIAVELGRAEGIPDVASSAQPYAARHSQSDDAFNIRFQRHNIVGPEASAPPPNTKLSRTRSLHGASFEFGATSGAATDRKRRWLPCFAAFEALEKGLVGLQDSQAGGSDDDASALQPVSLRDKDEALVEGFESEAADMAAFLQRWAEALQARLNIVSVKLNVSRHSHLTSQPSRAIQVGDPAPELGATRLDSDEDSVSIMSSRSGSSLESLSMFAKESTTKRVSVPFAWVKSSRNNGFVVFAERVVCATRLQAAFRGFLCRRVVGNVLTGRRTIFQARHLGLSKAWLAFRDQRGAAEASPGTIRSVLKVATQLLVGFAGQAQDARVKPMFSAFLVDFFAEAFSDPTARWEHLGKFLEEVNATQRSDPVASLMFCLIMGDFNHVQEMRFVEVLVAFVRTQQPQASASLLPLDLMGNEPMSPAAIRSLLRASTSLGDLRLSLGACHRRFWSVADILIPSWAAPTDFSTLNGLDRGVWQSIHGDPDPSAPERKVSDRQALFFAALAFCTL